MDMMSMDLDLSGWHDRSIDCEATELYTAEQMCAIKTKPMLNWGMADLQYARPTVILMVAFIAVFALVHRAWIRYAAKNGRSHLKIPLAVSAIAGARYLASAQIRVRGWCSVSYGNAIFISLFGLYFLLMTVVPGQYYWPEASWGDSPPLATRAGWLGLGPLPILLVLASKRNYISYLTDISHEKLQVFHRWTAFFMFITGAIHAFAFIYKNAKEGTLMDSWMMGSSWWTGVAMFVPQAWLTFASLVPIRNRWYEFFKLSHRVVAAIFVIFFFLHCADILDSWSYTYAAVAIYGSSILFRLGSMVRNRVHLRRSFATLKYVGHDLLTIRIPQSGLKWSAGQHMFFRFTGINAFDSLQSHPYTIASISSESSSDVVAVARVRRGETKHLADLAHWQGPIEAEVWLDGPYGDKLKMLPVYEHILLLGGGSGLTYIVAVANKLVKEHARNDVRIVATCRTARQLQIYLDLLPTQNELLDTPAPYHLTSHVTEDRYTEQHLEADHDPMLQDIEEKTEKHDIAVSRPTLQHIIRRAAQKAGNSRLAIVACGPPSFMADVQDEAAALNKEIMLGRTQLMECYLRSEAFYW